MKNYFIYENVDIKNLDQNAGGFDYLDNQGGKKGKDGSSDSESTKQFDGDVASINYTCDTSRHLYNEGDDHGQHNHDEFNIHKNTR